MAGISLGGMHASKETFVLAATALVLAVVLDRVLWKERSKSITAAIRPISWRHMLAFTGVAVLTSVLFYSSFFKNPQGIIDSVSTYGNYLSRATGNEIHHHPWYYYIAMLTWNPGPGWIVWSELPVLIMSLYGMIVVFRKTENNRADQFFRVMALFTLLLLVIYSMIPYKTPWNMLTFYVGMTWLAGYGTVHLFMQLKNPVLKILFSTFLLISAAFLLFQVLMTNTKYPADSSNPYVYAHTSTDVYHMTGQIEEVAAKHPEGKSLYIQVVAPDHDYWPLPWYLRKYNHVGWWNQVDVETPLAPVIIASPVFEEQLIEKMYKFPEPGERYLYVPLFNEGSELRPGTRLNGYIRQDIR